MPGPSDTSETEWITLLECFQTSVIPKFRMDQRQQFVPDHIVIEILFSNRDRAAVSKNHSAQ